MFMPDRHRLRLVFQDLHAHAVGRHDEGLILPVVEARQHHHTRRLPLRDALLNVVNDEPDVVDHRALGSAIAFLRR